MLSLLGYNEMNEPVFFTCRFCGKLGLHPECLKKYRDSPDGKAELKIEREEKAYFAKERKNDLADAKYYRGEAI